MAFTLEPNINVLWQNLIALNGSLMRENEVQRAELLQTKELLQKEMENSKILHETNAVHQQKIAKLCSKMVAVRQIVSYEPDDDPLFNATATKLPVIVKVESAASDTGTEYDSTSPVAHPRPVNVCSECDKKFRSSSALKNHMVFHLNPAYPCPKCMRKFPRKDYMKKHFKRAHQNEEYDPTQIDILIGNTRSTRTNTTL